MTEELLVYYTGLKEDIDSVRSQLRFLEKCIDGIDRAEWKVQIRLSRKATFDEIPIDRSRFYDLLLEKRSFYTKHLDDLERRFASNELLEVQK